VCAFWDLFEMGAAHGSSRREAWAACEPAAARGEPFKLHGVARRGGGGGAASPRRFTLKFRPALPEPDGAAQCGLALPPRGRPYFFVELDLDSAPTTPRGADAGWPGGARWGAPRAGADVGFGCGAGGGDGCGGGPDGGAAALCASPARSDPGCALASATSMPFPGLEVGKLLGRGAFGFVYCGTYQGATVAVKVPHPASMASLQVRLAGLRQVRGTRTGLPAPLLQAQRCAAGGRAARCMRAGQLKSRALTLKCAAQIIPDNPDARTQDGLPVEAHITAGLSHCNVVRTIAHAWRPLAFACHGGSVWDSAGSMPTSGAAGEGETWLLLELCNMGTLQVPPPRAPRRSGVAELSRMPRCTCGGCMLPERRHVDPL